MRRCRPLVLACIAALPATALLASGCGGGPSSPGVASIAGATTSAPTPNSPPAGGGSAQGGQSPRANSHFQIAMKVGDAAQGAKFSACMRKHGVPNFPDPNSQGVIQINSGMGIDPGSPAFAAARSACQKLLPNGGRPTPAQQAKVQQQLLAFSKCMRAHGIKDFPDPSGGGLQLRVGPGSDLDPNNPTFQQAQQACQKYMPFKGGSAKGG